MKRIKLSAATLVLALFLAFSPIASVLPTQNAVVTVEASSKVYVASSGNGKCYHKSKNCSRMRGRTRKLSKSKAKKQGYRACKKCYK